MTTENIHENSHRSLPYGLRNVVGELELRGATLVSSEQIAAYADVPAGSSAAYDIVRRLVAARWLRPLPLQGHYEFLPGAAGPFSRDDVLDPLRVMFDDPGPLGQVVLTGAAFLRGYADRAPVRFDVLLPRTKSISTSLRSLYRFHLVKPDRIFGAEILEGVPVSTRERLLIDVALWPDTIGAALRDREHWLGARACRGDDDDGRGHAASSRLARALPLEPGIWRTPLVAKISRTRSRGWAGRV